MLGEECHIASTAGQGPRADQVADVLDGYGNLILLCPNHHRLIDTIVDDYPVERLFEIKRGHEEWVKKSLERSTGIAAVTIVRGEPTFLRYLGSARELLGVAASAEESSLDHEDLRSEGDVDVVTGFLQNVHDTSEIWDEFEPANRVRYTFDSTRRSRTSKHAAGASLEPASKESCRAVSPAEIRLGTPPTFGLCAQTVPRSSDSISLATPRPKTAPLPERGVRGRSPIEAREVAGGRRSSDAII